jgi:hypothetical protein
MRTPASFYHWVRPIFGIGVGIADPSILLSTSRMTVRLHGEPDVPTRFVSEHSSRIARGFLHGS